MLRPPIRHLIPVQRRVSRRGIRVPPNALETAYRNQWKGLRCVFALSTGRVGTKTLARLLDQSAGVTGVHEPPPLLLRQSKEAYEHVDEQWEGSDKWKAVVEAARADMVCAANAQGRVYAETSNRLTYFAPTLAEFFPDSKFVFIHRQPLAVISSGMRRGWYVDHSWDWARIQPRAGDRYHDVWEGLSQVEKIAWYWRSVNEFSMYFGRTVPRERWLRLAAEDLFAGSEEVVNGLFSFLGVGNPNAQAVTRVLKERSNATRLRRGDLDVMPSAAIAAEVAPIVEDVAATLGYELN
jgi:hypothetical protein